MHLYVDFDLSQLMYAGKWMNRAKIVEHASSTSLTEQGGRAEPHFYFSWFMCAQICLNVLPFLCPARYGNNEDLFEPKYRLGKNKANW